MDFATWWKAVEPAMQFGFAIVVATILLWAMLTVWFRQTKVLEKLTEAHTKQSEWMRLAELEHKELLLLVHDLPNKMRRSTDTADHG